MKRIILGIIIFLIGFSLFASGAKEEKAAATGPATVRMWTFLNPNGQNLTGRNLALRKIIDNFEALHPQTKIQVEPQQWDIMSAKFLAAHEAGNAPDVAWVIMDEFGNALKLKALADLESLFVGKWSASDIEDVKDPGWEFGAKDGKHYEFYHSRNLTVIFYRQDLFARNGIQTPIRKWDDFIQAATKMTGDDPKLGIKRWGFGQGFLTGKVDPPLIFNAMLYDQDSPFTKDGKAKWATEAGIKATQLIIDMIKKYKITPEASISMSAEDLYPEFLSGKYAMITGGGVRMSRIRGEASMFDPKNIELMLTPSGDGQRYSPAPIQGWCVGVWSKSPVKQEAGAFLEFMSNREADKLWVLDGGQIPIRKSTITALSDFFSKPENKYISTLAEGIAKSGWAPPTDFSIGGWREEACNAIQDIITNGTAIPDALKKAEQEFNRKHQ